MQLSNHFKDVLKAGSVDAIEFFMDKGDYDLAKNSLPPFYDTLMLTVIYSFILI
jgi:hypothetical protein